MTKEQVKALIAEKIKPNGEGAITAAVLVDVLNAIVNGVGSRLVLCDLPITLFQLDAFRYGNNATDAERQALYNAIFGHDFVADFNKVAQDLAGLKESIEIKFTNLNVEGKLLGLSTMKFVAEVSENDSTVSLYAYLRAPHVEYNFVIYESF